MKKLFGRIADYFRETTKFLFFISIAAAGYGCVLIYSTVYHTGSERQFYVQLIALVIGVAVAVAVSLFDYKKVARRWYLWAALALALFAVVYRFGYAPDNTSNKAWINLPGGMSFQPSELVKICFILTFAYHAFKVQDHTDRPGTAILLILHGIVPAALVQLLQKDTGTAIVMICIFVSMFLASGVKMRYFAGFGAFLLASLPLVWLYGLSDYQKQRFLVIFNLDAEKLTTGWHQYVGRMAIGSGGLSGYGLMHGPLIQSGTVPKAYNDFIFAAAGEELGFIGCMLIIVIICALCVRILRIGYRSRDKMGTVICTGVFAIFAFQGLVNIGMCLAVLPVIGVTLPLFSAGGTSLLCMFAGLGLVISVHMHRSARETYLRDDFI